MAKTAPRFSMNSVADPQRQKENLIKQAYQQGFADGLLRHGMLKEGQAFYPNTQAYSPPENPIRLVGREWRDPKSNFFHPWDNLVGPALTAWRNDLSNAWNDRPAGSVELAAPASKERQQFDDKSRIKAQQLRDAPAKVQLSNARGNAPGVRLPAQPAASPPPTKGSPKPLPETVRNQKALRYRTDSAYGTGANTSVGTSYGNIVHSPPQAIVPPPVDPIIAKARKSWKPNTFGRPPAVTEQPAP